jgi:hypothetical protein
MNARGKLVNRTTNDNLGDTGVQLLADGIIHLLIQPALFNRLHVAPAGFNGKPVGMGGHHFATQVFKERLGLGGHFIRTVEDENPFNRLKRRVSGVITIQNARLSWGLVYLSNNPHYYHRTIEAAMIGM